MNNDDYGEDMDRDEIVEIELEAQARKAKDESQVDPGLCVVNGTYARRSFPVEDY